MNALVGVVNVLPLESRNFRKPQSCGRDQKSHRALWFPHERYGSRAAFLVMKKTPENRVKTGVGKSAHSSK
jgi:hypothetical protein